MSKLLLRIIGLFTGKKVVQLFADKASKAELRGPFYTLMDKKVLKRDAQVKVYVYHYTRVGEAILFPGGTVSNQSRSSYIKGWKYV